MKTLRNLVFCLVTILALPVGAETQAGFVRTIGRNGKPGQPISGVMVRAEGPANMVMSDTQGQFTLVLHEAGRDDAFRISSVKKSNYELLDKDLIGRDCGFTPVPMEIVLMNQAEMQAEKAAMAERFERQYAETYQKKVTELQAQYEAKQITQEEAASRQEELDKALETMLGQIETLVDRYVRTDYDRLDSLDQVINAHIEQGEFDEAERLIRSKGSIEKRLADLQEGQEAQKQIEEAQRKLAAANAKKHESLKRDLKLLIDIADAHLRPDSAYYYRKQLQNVTPEDVDNLERLMQTAFDFGEYEQMFQFFDQTEKVYLSQTTIDTLAMAALYKNLGDILDFRMRSFRVIGPDTLTGLDYYNKQIDLICSFYGENTLQCADVIREIGIWSYSLREDLDRGKRNNYIDRAINCYNNILQKDSSNLYAQLGLHRAQIWRINKGKEKNRKELLSILEKAKNNPNSNDSLVKEIIFSQVQMVNLFTPEEVMGMLFAYYPQHMNNYIDTLEMAMHINWLLSFDLSPEITDSCSQYALKLLEKEPQQKIIKWRNREESIITLRNSEMSELYHARKEYDKVIELYMQELQQYIQIYGANNAKVGEKYSHIAELYLEKGEENNAKKYYQQATEIGNNIPVLYDSFWLMFANEHLGDIYIKDGQYESAINYLQKAMRICKEKPYPLFYYARQEFHLGKVYKTLGDTKKAKPLFKEAMAILNEEGHFVNAEYINLKEEVKTTLHNLK